MSINVTLGEVKTQEVKPFPKLMKSELGQIIYAIEFSNENKSLIVGFLLHSNGYGIGRTGFSESWGAHLFTDYNEPITLQNA